MKGLVNKKRRADGARGGRIKKKGCKMPDIDRKRR